MSRRAPGLVGLLDSGVGAALGEFPRALLFQVRPGTVYKEEQWGGGEPR